MAFLASVAANQSDYALQQRCCLHLGIVRLGNLGKHIRMAILLREQLVCFVTILEALRLEIEVEPAASAKRDLTQMHERATAVSNIRGCLGRGAMLHSMQELGHMFGIATLAA